MSLNWKGCPMCKFPIEDKHIQTSHTIHNKGEFSKVGININLRSGGEKQPTISFETFTEDKRYYTSMEIKYCPFCGMELSKNDPEIVKTATYNDKPYVGNY